MRSPQDDVGRVGEGVWSTPCTMSVEILPALRAASTQSVSPIEPSGPGR
jgi:hypothetical protein